MDERARPSGPAGSHRYDVVAGADVEEPNVREREELLKVVRLIHDHNCGFGTSAVR